MQHDKRLFLKLAATHQYLVRILERQLTPLGIPAYQLALVTQIRHNQPVSPSAISAASGIPPTTLRDNIQRLVDSDLIERIPNPTDGRSYLLRLTGRGEQMVKAADPALAEAYRAIERLLPLPLAAYEQTIAELNSAFEAAVETSGSKPKRG